MMERLAWRLLLGTILLISAVHAQYNKKPVAEDGIPEHITSPPRITRQPAQEIAYKTEERVELPCVAAGEPRPTFEWRKDGLPLDINGIDYKRLPGVGTLVIDAPKDVHEGEYQCLAKNELGTALSIKSSLKLAVLLTFPTVGEPYTHQPVVGNSLKLTCKPPYSYPMGLVYWGKNKPGTKFSPVETDARVSTDYEGNLYFANVVKEDNIEGKNYVCTIQNDILRSMSQGNDAAVVPFETGPTPNYAAPMVMWHSETPTVVIQGRTKKMKCIFSGYPTPTVRWERIGHPLPVKAEQQSSGQELMIPNAQYEDAGTYRCLANNTKSGTPVSRTFELRVNSLPIWVTEPESVDSSEEETAEFNCEAGGVPKPTVEWLVNGEDIANFPNDRRKLDGNKILFTNLSKSDAQVLQCNASNKHGYIFKNVYLNVLAEPPSFIKPPLPVVKVAEGQNVNLTCRVFGAPKPIVTWWNGDQKVTGTRFQIIKTGDLQILNVQLTDDGTYECSAWNKFGEEQKSGNLIVRRRTVIIRGPEEQAVNASTDVVLHCDATTDNAEVARLKIEWLRNGFPIDLEREGRISMNVQDHSLRITGAQVIDTAEYTCIASNGLDSTSQKAKLTVKDRPSPPYDIRLESCATTSAQVSWEASSDNNDPLLDFTVYYNTSFDTSAEDTFFHVAKEGVPANVKSARVVLSPWANYTFHIKARNSLGYSERSAFTAAYCTTPPNIPYRNPANVCSRSGKPDQLIITWEPMPLMEHNGEDFHYVVSYRRVDNDEQSDVIEVRVDDYKQGELIIPGQRIFQKYEIFVQAANQKGRSPSELERKNAFSGEDTPLDSPSGMEIDEATLNATYALFMWRPIDEDPQRVRGHFRGYRITYWQSDEDDEDKRRYTDVILNDYDVCPPLSRSGRTGRQAQPLISGHVFDLWPYSDISAAVSVLNGGNTGPLSSPVLTFRTPEGLPGIVPFLEVTERGSHHLKISWGIPTEPNGVITGYQIRYQPVDVYGAFEEKIEPMVLSSKLTDLEEKTKYLIYVSAITMAGPGVEMFIEGDTLPLSSPDTPGFADIEYGETSLNVSWTPTADGQKQKNPGQEFYVEIRKLGDDDWERTDPESTHNWSNITDLEPGESYELRIVAVNGAGDETRSPAIKVTVGPKEEAIQQNIATAGWFIGILCALIFLLLIILIVCLIKRNRGGKYPVHEKEKLRGRDPDREDDPEFGEYTRTDYPAEKTDPERDSLASDRPMGSDSDSMAEYGDPDLTGGFDEDGSFIKQYGTGKRGAPGSDAHTNNAFSTFV